MKPVETKDKYPDVHLHKNVDSVNDAVFITPSVAASGTGQVHSTYECQGVRNSNIVYGYHEDEYDTTCNWCSKD